jgi:trigger factor
VEETPKRQPYCLPQIEAPSLDDLRVQLASPSPPTAEELIERLHQRLRQCASRRQRDPGEPIEMGDEVECDLITLVEGRPIPGGIHSLAHLEVREFLHLPGLLEQLLSMTTFSAKTFELVLPQDYPVPWAAGRTATIFVEARRVFQIAPTDLEDSAALRAAGLGDNLEQAMEAIAAEIDAEQGEELLVDATQTVLQALAGRVSAEVPPAAVDEELRQIWQKSEGAVLSGKNLSADLLANAQAAFLRDPFNRQQAEQRIKAGLALGALVEKEGLSPSAETMTMLLKSAAEQTGVPLEQAKASLKSEPLSAQQAGQTALYLNAVEFVMSRALVDVLDPPEPAADEQVTSSAPTAGADGRSAQLPADGSQSRP